MFSAGFEYFRINARANTDFPLPSVPFNAITSPGAAIFAKLAPRASVFNFIGENIFKATFTAGSSVLPLIICPIKFDNVSLFVRGFTQLCCL